VGAIPTLVIRDRSASAGNDAGKGSRRVWFRQAGEVEARVWDRARMPAGHVVAGPAVIESLESTILLPPQWQGAMDADGFVLMRRSPSLHSSSQGGEGTRAQDVKDQPR
jgi:N-methylhydantoinase A